MLDVEAMELDARGPRERVGFQEVFDLVIVDIQGEDTVRGLRHELLAEVGPNEATGANHANGDGLYGVPIQIYSRRSHYSETIKSIREEIGSLELI